MISIATGKTPHPIQSELLETLLQIKRCGNFSFFTSGSGENPIRLNETDERKDRASDLRFQMPVSFGDLTYDPDVIALAAVSYSRLSCRDLSGRGELVAAFTATCIDDRSQHLIGFSCNMDTSKLARLHSFLVANPRALEDAVSVFDRRDFVISAAPNVRSLGGEIRLESGSSQLMYTRHPSKPPFPENFLF